MTIRPSLRFSRSIFGKRIRFIPTQETNRCFPNRAEVLPADIYHAACNCRLQTSRLRPFPMLDMRGYACTYIHTYTYTHIHTYTYTHTYIYTYIHTYTHMHISCRKHHMDMYACMHVCMCVCMYVPASHGFCPDKCET
jgi:hypothetical protein